MFLRRSTVVVAAGLLVAAVTTSTAAQAQPAAPAGTPLTADAMAVNAAQSLVASRPAALHASSDDAFTQQNIISSTNGLKYVPYQRTYKGLPVVGGDFVVATNATGQVVATSVAQDATIALASTTPKLTSAQAQAVARGQLSKVDSVGAAQLVTYALGTPTLAWQSTVTGTKDNE